MTGVPLYRLGAILLCKIRDQIEGQLVVGVLKSAAALIGRYVDLGWATTPTGAEGTALPGCDEAIFSQGT